MLKRYFDDLTEDLARESERIRAFFATHALSAGINREELVARLLRAHIIPSVGVEAGLILARNEEFSNQADVILVDRQSNGPLYGPRRIPIWLKEAVYGVIEVKTQLSPSTLSDSVRKCVRLKRLPNSFADSLGRQKVTDTLFCVWAFRAPDDLQLVKANIESAISGLAQSEQPDLIIVPGCFLWRGGHYFDISTNGQPGSDFYQQRIQSIGGDLERLLIPSFEMLNLGTNALTVFFYWLNNWLYAAGPRRPDLIRYYPVDSWGEKV